MDDRLLTTEEAAERLGLGRHTLEVWRMRGEGPAFSKLGGRLVRYQRTDLDAFIAETRRSGGVRDTVI